MIIAIAYDYEHRRWHLSTDNPVGLWEYDNPSDLAGQIMRLTDRQIELARDAERIRDADPRCEDQDHAAGHAPDACGPECDKMTAAEWMMAHAEPIPGTGAVII